MIICKVSMSAIFKCPIGNSLEEVMLVQFMNSSRVICEYVSRYFLSTFWDFYRVLQTFTIYEKLFRQTPTLQCPKIPNDRQKCSKGSND